MVPLRTLFVFLGLLASGPAAPAAADKANAPDVLVAALYKQTEKTSPFFQSKSRKAIDRWFAKPLADLLWKDAHHPDGEVGALDFDPLYDAQDFEPKNLVIHPAKIAKDHATVAVTFVNFNEKKEILYQLVQGEDAAWKISDVKWATDRTLLGLLNEAYPK